MHQVARFLLLSGMLVIPLLAGCGASKGITKGEEGNVTDLGTSNAKSTRPGAPPEDVKRKTEQPGAKLPTPGNAPAPGKQPGLPPGRGGPG
jgi:hypothetical protein